MCYVKCLYVARSFSKLMLIFYLGWLCPEDSRVLGSKDKTFFSVSSFLHFKRFFFLPIHCVVVWHSSQSGHNCWKFYSIIEKVFFFCMEMNWAVKWEGLLCIYTTWMSISLLSCLGSLIRCNFSKDYEMASQFVQPSSIDGLNDINKLRFHSVDYACKQSLSGHTNAQHKCT